MGRRSRRSWKPEVARLETREVPTVVSPLAFGGAGLKAQLAAQRSLDNVLAGSRPAATSSSTDQSSVQPFNGNSGNFQIGGNPNPTPLDSTLLSPAGFRRAKFISSTTGGSYAVSPPSFVGELRSIYYVGRVTANQFLHGTLVMRLDTPNLSTNPSGQIVGIASLRDRNVAATGNVLQVDLSAAPSNLDQFGRPTTLNWVVDDNGSGGTYAGAPGSGTVTITYTQSGHATGGAGRANITFNGLVLANGTADITAFTLGKF
jgi:hypothetical protein